MKLVPALSLSLSGEARTAGEQRKPEPRGPQIVEKNVSAEPRRLRPRQKGEKCPGQKTPEEEAAADTYFHSPAEGRASREAENGEAEGCTRARAHLLPLMSGRASSRVRALSVCVSSCSWKITPPRSRTHGKPDTLHNQVLLIWKYARALERRMRERASPGKKMALRSLWRDAGHGRGGGCGARALNSNFSLLWYNAAYAARPAHVHGIYLLLAVGYYEKGGSYCVA